MGSVRAWLSDTQVPRWQFAIGFILATLITASVSYYSGKWSSERQASLSMISEFRQSAEQLDSAANQITNAVVDKRNLSEAKGKFQHAIIVHFHDIDAMSSAANPGGLLKAYRSSVADARVAADRIKTLDDLQSLFLKMAEVRRRQLKVLEKADSAVH